MGNYISTAEENPEKRSKQQTRGHKQTRIPTGSITVPSVIAPLYFFAVFSIVLALMALPQLGQAGAISETSFPQSGQFINAMI